MSNSLLDWGLQNIETLKDSSKCEFILLASLIDPEHPIVSVIDFNNRTYESIASWLIPTSGFTRTESEDFNYHRIEFIYLLALEGNLLPEFIEIDLSNPLLMVHQLFFVTNFGEVIFEEDEEVRALILSELEQDPWNGLYPHPYILQEWYGELLMALLCIGEELDQDKVSFVLGLEQNFSNITTQNYHAFMVLEILKAMIDRQT